jgi:Mg-chelatase subunit ChlD
MVFGKGFRAKFEKVFSSSSQDPKVSNDPPPPYLPEEFRQAGIKEDELEALRNYDTVIILDDSGSMEPLWHQASRALSTLAVVASKYDKDGIDIHFLNNTKAGEHVKSEEEVIELFREVTPAGPTPLGECLERVTERLLKDLDKGKSRKKTNYLIITDGQPTDDAESAIVQIAKRLDKAGATLTQLGMQFIQIGTNEGARKYLVKLDNDLKEKHEIRDMVDTEPFTNGELTATRLTKLLLGGINRKIDKS